MDLLGSILGSMEKPPSIGSEEKKRQKEEKARLEKLERKEKQKLIAFRTKIQKRIDDFIKDSSAENFKFDPMEKVSRAICHEVADVAGLASFSFGQDEVDRYVMCWKKEFAPSDEELLAYRRGEEWDPEKAKELAKQKVEEEAEDKVRAKELKQQVPTANYKEKYEHLIGKVAAKDAAKLTTANRSYGFVPSENKRDQRTIEQVMADTRARKKQKTSHDEDTDSAAALEEKIDTNEESTSQS